MQFKDLLPLLVSTYYRGDLVPFLGAGMSMPMLDGWLKFIEALERTASNRTLKRGASNSSCSPCPPRPQELYGRAQRAATLLRNYGKGTRFYNDISAALGKKSDLVPEQTQALARIKWPLAISSNYDDLYYGECLKSWNEFRVEVLGRSALDCKRIISSLNGPFDRQLVWHVQGFLGGQHPEGAGREIDDERLALLQSELVIGHAEYRRVTNTEPHFHRCFGEIFRTRSFLFLGSNLSEDYFLNMFGEVIELCGPSSVPHFAFVAPGSVDGRFLADQMNIRVCEIKYEDQIGCLALLKLGIDAAARTSRWSFSCQELDSCDADLEIIRSKHPQLTPDVGAIAVSTGRKDNKPELGDWRPAELSTTELAEASFPADKYVVRYGATRFYAMSARTATNVAEPCGVYNAVQDLLDTVTKDGYNCVHVSLPSSACNSPFSDVYAFSPVYAFIEAVHAFADWRRTPEKGLGSPRL